MKIEDLRNLGPRSADMLSEIEIETPAQLRDLGAEEAYRRLRFRFGEKASINMLYALHGALADRDWRSFEPQERALLKEQASKLNGLANPHPL